MPRKNADTLSRQQKAALTRQNNRHNRERYVTGFMEGYLMGCFDTKHRIPRHISKVRRLAEMNAEDENE